MLNTNFKARNKNRNKLTLKIHSSTWLPPIASSLIAIIVWESITSLFDIPKYVIPAPHDILKEFIFEASSLLRHGLITITEAVLGFLLGSIAGMLLGGVFAYSRTLERSFLPHIVASNTIPVVAIAPIVILWFGFGITSKVVVAAFLCFFPLCLNMLKGMKSTRQEILDIFRVYGAAEWQIFWKCRFPASLPFIFTGLKLNATYSVIGAIVAEFVGSSAGIGFAIVQAAYVLNTPRLWAAIFLSAVFGIGFFHLVGFMERILVPWSKGRSETLVS